MNTLLDKKTKIVCTIGPATESTEMLVKLLNTGMNVMRLNFSHGDFKEHQARIVNLKEAMKKTGKTCAIMQDLSGPKIRIGTFAAGQVTLKEGQLFTLTTEKIEGDENRVHINYPMLPKEVSKGHIIFLHDGRKKLEVVEVKGNDVVCKVLVGGDIKGKRGVNLPDSDLSISSMTEKDKEDFEFGIKNKVDYFALSFVRRPSDVIELREMLNARKSDAKIISKIETPQSLKCIDEIISLSDAIMVARGDLAAEIPTEQVPVATKNLIEKCNYAGKPVIHATQVMESMISAPVPTRAEVSDCANAVYDGTDAVMLSEETTLGQFPVQAVDTMARIARTVEADPRYIDGRNTMVCTGADNDSVIESAIMTAEGTEASAIVILTDDFNEIQSLASAKPGCPVIAMTTKTIVAGQANLSFAVQSVLVSKMATRADFVKEAKAYALKNKFAIKGARIVLVYGESFGKSKTVNTVSVDVI